MDHSSLRFRVIIVTVGKPPRAGFWTTSWATRGPAPEVEKAEASPPEVYEQLGAEEEKCSGMTVPDPATLRRVEGHRNHHAEHIYSCAQSSRVNALISTLTY